ncbi:Os01g0789000 [Oryza sativa Japonica Group]|uniref:Os01g0789000 protein n=1 Tax=Oryza sativa subsp. japonica TaxID=39947 RepID=Q0JIM9_ORYSJ|nr:Os01g0789000 [Oryza sativa Japonica Group]|eukprot:NP_001044485.1 Os01g0789000 [Oryza sativa Japonica Group]
MESDTDLISVLPGEVLQHILSFSRIRAIVRMRRLSRRWMRVIECLQFICLDYRDFKHWKVEKFARFVDNLLLIRSKVDLHTFQLYWFHYLPLNCNDLRKWILYAVKHNVKVLDVELDMYDKTALPSRIFTCRSVEELSLQMGEAPDEDLEHVGLVLPDIIQLPSLKKLTLSDVEVDQLSLNQFIGRSPNLEDLHLINSATYLDLIASKVLKRLTLDGFMHGPKRFTISAPHLVHFECQGCALQDVSWGEKPSLESAHIDTWGKKYDGESEFIGVLLSAKTLALFGSDVKFLVMTCSLTQYKVMLEKELPACPVFERLTTLEIARKGAETDAMPIDGMTFQCPFLETVIIQCSKGDDGINKLVNVLAANGINPKKIQVNFYEDIEEMERAENRRIIEEREKELCNFEKMAKKNPEWVDESRYADSNPETDSDEYDDDYDDF